MALPPTFRDYMMVKLRQILLTSVIAIVPAGMGQWKAANGKLGVEDIEMKEEYRKRRASKELSKRVQWGVRWEGKGRL